MPSRKTISVLVLCLAIIASVLIVAKKPKQISQKNSGGVKSDVVESVIKIDSKENDDWKKILTSVDTKTNNIKTVSLSSDEDNDSTLTDQLSRDILAQYLLAIKNNTPISKEVAETITKNTLSLPTYNLKPVEYLRSNLKITPKTDKNTLIKYGQDINQALIGVYFNISDDPMYIMMDAMKSENENDLKKLDPIIEVNKKVIKDLLETEVPETAVKIHLEILNNASKLLLDIESMRESLSDPIKTFTVLTNFDTDFKEFKKSMLDINNFLLNNSI